MLVSEGETSLCVIADSQMPARSKRLYPEDTRLWPPSPMVRMRGWRRDRVADGEFYPPAVRLRTSSEIGLTFLLTRKGCAQIQECRTIRLRLSRENSRDSGAFDRNRRGRAMGQTHSTERFSWLQNRFCKCSGPSGLHSW